MYLVSKSFNTINNLMFNINFLLQVHKTSTARFRKLNMETITPSLNFLPGLPSQLLSPERVL